MGRNVNDLYRQRAGGDATSPAAAIGGAVIDAFSTRERRARPSPAAPGTPQSVTTFNPTIPATISPTHASRASVAASPNSAIPRITVPTAPIPVHTA